MSEKFLHADGFFDDEEYANFIFTGKHRAARRAKEEAARLAAEKAKIPLQTFSVIHNYLPMDASNEIKALAPKVGDVISGILECPNNRVSCSGEELIMNYTVKDTIVTIPITALSRNSTRTEAEKIKLKEKLERKNLGRTEANQLLGRTESNQLLGRTEAEIIKEAEAEIARAKGEIKQEKDIEAEAKESAEQKRLEKLGRPEKKIVPPTDVKTTAGEDKPADAEKKQKNKKLLLYGAASLAGLIFLVILVKKLGGAKSAPSK